MNDQALIERLQQGSPAELSLPELLKLQRRMRRSPKVRQALADELLIDQTLYHALGEADLPMPPVTDLPSAPPEPSAAAMPTDVRFPPLGFNVAALVTLVLGLSIAFGVARFHHHIFGGAKPPAGPGTAEGLLPTLRPRPGEDEPPAMPPEWEPPTPSPSDKLLQPTDDEDDGEEALPADGPSSPPAAPLP